LSIPVTQRLWTLGGDYVVCCGARLLLIAKFSGSTVSVTVDGTRYDLTREEAEALRDRLADALTGRYQFVHTAGTYRADGSYEVARRRVESSGHAKVFDSFGALERLFEDLPREFAAEDVEHAGVSGSRRHMLVHHFAEHPAFPCELARRQPLTARKTGEVNP